MVRMNRIWIIVILLVSAVSLQAQSKPRVDAESLLGCYKLVYSDGQAVFDGAGFHSSVIRLDSILTAEVSRRRRQYEANARAFWPAESKPDPGHFPLSFFVPYWYVSGDTVFLMQSDGFTGEFVRLRGNAQRLSGTVEFFTDVVPPKPPSRHPVTAERVPCPLMR